MLFSYKLLPWFHLFPRRAKPFSVLNHFYHIPHVTKFPKTVATNKNGTNGSFNNFILDFPFMKNIIKNTNKHNKAAKSAERIEVNTEDKKPQYKL